MSKAAKDQAALTRLQAEESKLEWERLQKLYKNSMQELSLFGTETAPASLLLLSTLLTEDTDDPENLWKICAQIKLVSTQDAAYKRKISAVEKIVSRMDAEILNTPVSPTVDGAITAEDRQHEVTL